MTTLERMREEAIEAMLRRADRDILEKIMRDPHHCDHDFQPSGMFLMKMADDINALGIIVGQKVVGGNAGLWKHQTPEVQICKGCGLLRIETPEEDDAVSG